MMIKNSQPANLKEIFDKHEMGKSGAVLSRFDIKAKGCTGARVYTLAMYPNPDLTFRVFFVRCSSVHDMEEQCEDFLTADDAALFFKDKHSELKRIKSTYDKLTSFIVAITLLLFVFGFGTELVRVLSQ